MLYYPYLYEIEKSEKLHGEHSAAEYGKPFNVMMVLEIKDAPSNLQILGFDNDETVTAWIHIKSFRNTLRFNYSKSALRLRRIQKMLRITLL